MYREVENKIPKPKHEPYDKSERKVVETSQGRKVTGSKGTYVVKRGGYTKKTLSILMDG